MTTASDLADIFEASGFTVTRSFADHQEGTDPDLVPMIVDIKVGPYTLTAEERLNGTEVADIFITSNPTSMSPAGGQCCYCGSEHNVGTSGGHQICDPCHSEHADETTPAGCIDCEA